MPCASGSLSTQNGDSKWVASLDESRSRMRRGIDVPRQAIGVPRQAIHVPRYDLEGTAPRTFAVSDERPCAVAPGYRLRWIETNTFFSPALSSEFFSELLGVPRSTYYYQP